MYPAVQVPDSALSLPNARDLAAYDSSMHANPLSVSECRSSTASAISNQPSDPTLNQSYGNLELIISDNASTDRTEAICRDLAASDARIKSHRNERNIGAAAKYNKFLQPASGEFFRWSNADDLMDSELVGQTLPVLQSTPDAVIAYGRTGLIDENGTSLGEYDDNMDIQEDLPADRYMSFHNRAADQHHLRSDAGHCNAQHSADGAVIPAPDIQPHGTMVLRGKLSGARVLFFRRMHALQ